MGSPKIDIYQVKVDNPDASAPLHIPMAVLCNTPDDQLADNIKANGALDRRWLEYSEPHDRIAVVVGGGPSVEDDLELIRDHYFGNATIFAINGASKWLGERGINPDWQVTCDAQLRTADLVDTEYALGHLFGSQVHPDTMHAVLDPIVWHLEIGDVEQHLPPERVKRGGYVLVGGGASSGNSACCIAYCMGYRNIHVFGFDSSNRDGATHAYAQPMNEGIPNIPVTWAGKQYDCSVAMRAQAEKFQITASELERLGCKVTVHGTGLLPDMWRTPVKDLSERDVYVRMWMNDDYRTHSPGEMVVPHIAEFCEPGPVIDFGCGTGRTSVELEKRGFQPALMDFAENCRDDEAMHLPFIEWDLTEPCPYRMPWGYCCDVMEHIAPEDVDTVLFNISMACSKGVFFRIEHEPDVFGPATIGRPLHLSVHGPDWWIPKLAEFFDDVEFKGDGIYHARHKG